MKGNPGLYNYFMGIRIQGKEWSSFEQAGREEGCAMKNDVQSKHV
jgi:hypothetical protein